MPDLIVYRKRVDGRSVVTVYPAGRLSPSRQQDGDGRHKPWTFCNNRRVTGQSVRDAEELVAMATALWLAVESRRSPAGFPFMDGPSEEPEKSAEWTSDERLILREDRLTEETLRRAALSTV